MCKKICCVLMEVNEIELCWNLWCTPSCPIWCVIDVAEVWPLYYELPLMRVLYSWRMVITDGNYLVKAENLFQELSWRIGICTIPQLIIVEFCNKLFRQWWDHLFLVIFFVQSIRSLLICLICLIVYSCMCCLWLYCVLLQNHDFMFNCITCTFDTCCS